MVQLSEEHVIERRTFMSLVSGGLLAAPLACFAQQQRSKVARIGLLEAISASNDAKWREALIAGLRELPHERRTVLRQDQA
jgi:hypothetical protein